jgi:pimeloyl-ACP methyl ester carboxylesterase
MTNTAGRMPEGPPMAAFVIVHGAWSGPHAWRWVRPLLRDAGHEVFTPAMTGLGERAHLATPATDLNTHLEDVVAVLHYEDLRDVVLVGHSYGGMVITGVADRVGDRLAQLVYLDGDVPLDGECELDMVPLEERREYEEAARSRGGGWRIPPPFPEVLPPGTDPTVVWVVARMVPHPLRTFTQPVHLAAGRPSAASRTYIHCTEGKEATEQPPYVRRVADDPAWRFVELQTSHVAHVMAPEMVAAALLDLVGPTP